MILLLVIISYAVPQHLPLFVSPRFGPEIRLINILVIGHLYNLGLKYSSSLIYYLLHLALLNGEDKVSTDNERIEIPTDLMSEVNQWYCGSIYLLLIIWCSYCMYSDSLSIFNVRFKCDVPVVCITIPYSDSLVYFHSPRRKIYKLSLLLQFSLGNCVKGSSAWGGVHQSI